MNFPKVSVIMASYNHAKYINYAIDSVLAQQGVDIEFLIIDDGSTDGSQDIISAYTDKRIKYYLYTANRGASVVTNELIGKTTNEYIALINSDDFWVDENKLAIQIDILENDSTIGACFGYAKYVDENNNILSKEIVKNGFVFDRVNRSQSEWLRYFFDHGNCLCHPTVLIRKSCYDEVGLYDVRLRQLPDFDMWVRLIKKYGIHIIQRDLIAFRVLPDKSASSPTRDNLQRIRIESYFVLRRFFDGVSDEMFLDAFMNKLKIKACENGAQVEIEKALIYFDKKGWGAQIYELIGLEKLHQLLGLCEYKVIMDTKYGIDEFDFNKRAAENDLFNLDNAAYAIKAASGRRLIREMLERVKRRINNLISRIE